MATFPSPADIYRQNDLNAKGLIDIAEAQLSQAWAQIDEKIREAVRLTLETAAKSTCKYTRHTCAISNPTALPSTEERNTAGATYLSSPLAQQLIADLAAWKVMLTFDPYHFDKSAGPDGWWVGGTLQVVLTDPNAA